MALGSPTILLSAKSVEGGLPMGPAANFSTLDWWGGCETKLKKALGSPTILLSAK
jgi:hypothetical protein